MNRLIALSLIGCFSLNAFYEWLFVWWMDLPELPESMWAGYDLSKILIIVILSWIIWLTFPLSKLFLKSLAFIVFLEAVCTLVQFFYNGQYQGSLECVKVAAFGLWFLWAYFRSYTPISDRIEPRTVYWVAHRPDTISGFFLSLFGNPLGGFSVLIDHKVYGYSKGKFKIRNMPSKQFNIVAMEANVENSQELRDWLNSMQGKKWSLFHNCITLIMRVKSCAQMTN